MSVAYAVRGIHRVPCASDDAAEARWIPLAEVRELAFDHDEILRDAQRRTRR